MDKGIFGLFAKNKLILLVYWNQSILVTFLCFVSFRFKLQLFTKQLPIKFFQCISMFASLLSLDWKRDSILLRYANHLSIFFSVSEHAFFLFVRTDRKRVLRIDSIYDYRIIYIFYAVRIFCKIKLSVTGWFVFLRNISNYKCTMIRCCQINDSL